MRSRARVSLCSRVSLSFPASFCVPRRTTLSNITSACSSFYPCAFCGTHLAIFSLLSFRISIYWRSARPFISRPRSRSRTREGVREKRSHDFPRGPNPERAGTGHGMSRLRHDVGAPKWRKDKERKRER